MYTVHCLSSVREEVPVINKNNNNNNNNKTKSGLGEHLAGANDMSSGIALNKSASATTTTTTTRCCRPLPGAAAG